MQLAFFIILMHFWKLLSRAWKVAQINYKSFATRKVPQRQRLLVAGLPLDFSLMFGSINTYWMNCKWPHTRSSAHNLGVQLLYILFSMLRISPECLPIWEAEITQHLLGLRWADFCICYQGKANVWCPLSSRSSEFQASSASLLAECQFHGLNAISLSFRNIGTHFFSQKVAFLLSFQLQSFMILF